MRSLSFFINIKIDKNKKAKNKRNLFSTIIKETPKIKEIIDKAKYLILSHMFSIFKRN